MAVATSGPESTKTIETLKNSAMSIVAAAESKLREIREQLQELKTREEALSTERREWEAKKAAERTPKVLANTKPTEPQMLTSLTEIGALDMTEIAETLTGDLVSTELEPSDDDQKVEVDSSSQDRYWRRKQTVGQGTVKEGQNSTPEGGQVGGGVECGWSDGETLGDPSARDSQGS